MRGVKNGSVVYEVLRQISFAPAIEYPQTLFVSEGKNIVTPREGDVISHEGLRYQIERDVFLTSYKDGKKTYEVCLAIMREVPNSPDLETRTVLHP